jgi:hypothetical protein
MSRVYVETGQLQPLSTRMINLLHIFGDYLTLSERF